MAARVQVLGCSLEAHVLKSDNSALAKDCRREMKAVTTRLGKLGRKVQSRSLKLPSVSQGTVAMRFCGFVVAAWPEHLPAC